MKFSGYVLPWRKSALSRVLLFTIILFCFIFDLVIIFFQFKFLYTCSRMISGYENGTTPNPDVLCNRYIKFGHFFDHIFHEVEADAVATGHYAQNSAGNYLERVKNSEGWLGIMMYYL